MREFRIDAHQARAGVRLGRGQGTEQSCQAWCSIPVRRPGFSWPQHGRFRCQPGRRPGSQAQGRWADRGQAVRGRL